MKSEQNLTNQQLSELSGVPKSTVDRILRDEGTSPTVETAAALVRALNGSLDEALDIGSLALTPSVPPNEDPEYTAKVLGIVRDIVVQVQNMHHSVHRVKDGAYQSSIKARDHWLTFSVAVNCVFIAWLIYDLLHPTRGWIQYELSIKNLQQGLIGGWSLCSLWWGRLRL